MIIAVSGDFGGSEEIECLICVRHDVAYVTHFWMYGCTDVSADFVFAGVLTRHKECMCFLDAIKCRKTQVVFDKTYNKLVILRSALLQISPNFNYHFIVCKGLYSVVYLLSNLASESYVFLHKIPNLRIRKITDLTLQSALI